LSKPIMRNKGRHALRLWRGQAFEGARLTLALQAEAAALESARLAVWEQYIEARLSGGDSSDLVVDVCRLLLEQPLRESLWRQYLRLLHQAGRKAEALAAYDDLRVRLDEEFGCAPAAQTRDLMCQIASDDIVLRRVGRPGLERAG
jgi:DNA-binding SARP family transcriptional activator